MSFCPLFVDQQQLLLDAFNRDAFKKFQSILTESGVDPTDLNQNESVFEVLCRKPNAAKYIRECIKRRFDPNKKNKTTGFHPIHNAVIALQNENIKILLNTDKNLANQTQFYNKTCLHMLIEQLDDHNINQVFETMKLLLHYSASMDWPAVKSGFYTPFLMLLEKLAHQIKDKPKCLEILCYISSQCSLPSLDTFRNGEARKLLKKFFPGVMYKFSAQTEEDKINDEKFMQEFMEELLRSNPALFVVLLYTYSKKEPEVWIVNKLMDNGVLLKMAVKYNQLDIFKEVIAMGANINCVMTDNLTLVEITCAWGRPKMLKHLLDQKCEISDSQVPLLKLTLDNMNKDPLKSLEHYQCFEVLINHEAIDVNKKFINEDFKCTPLHYAATRNEFATEKLLQKLASLSTKNEIGVMPIELISPKLLKSYFDTCITVQGTKGDADYSLLIDFSCLQSKIERTNSPVVTNGVDLTKEMVTIEHISKNKDMHHLILHPLIMSFLYLKWKKFGPIFYANFLFHLVNYAAVMSYIMFSYCYSKEYSVWLSVHQLLMVLKEYLQFLISPKTYISSARNYFEILFIALVGLLWVYDSNEEKTIVFKITAVIIIIFVVFKVIQLLQLLPIISIIIYMALMRAISINFVLFFAFYSVVLVSFEFAFQLLLNGSAFKFIIDKDLTTAFEDKYTLLAVVFIFLITIVMVNLVIGLSVAENAMNQQKAVLQFWLGRALMLAEFEHAICDDRKISCKQWIKSCFGLTKFIQLFANLLDSKQVQIYLRKSPRNQPPINKPNAGSFEMLENAEHKRTCKSTETLEPIIVELALANAAEQAARMIEEKKEKDLKASLLKLDKKLIELLEVSFEED